MIGMGGTPSSDPSVRATLAECRLFAGLDDRTLALLALALRPRRYKRGVVIFHEDDPGDSLYIVMGGSVKITVSAEDGTEPTILATIGPGGFFGELALLDGAPRSATASALGPVETLVLGRAPFDRLVDEQPALRRALLVSLAREIRRLTGQVEDLHFLDLPGRLARHLLRLAPAEQGAVGLATVPEGEIRLPWPYTQGELAGMIGGSRQSVNRLLADFVGQGLLRFEGNDLIIPEPRRLAMAAAR
jgi:CRP/FNR family transcriptional regulator, cyclic AMP receptor protein